MNDVCCFFPSLLSLKNDLNGANIRNWFKLTKSYCKCYFSCDAKKNICDDCSYHKKK